MSGYGKHFESMYTGSMYGAGPMVFAVWGWVVAHVRDGYVEINPQKLADTIGKCTPHDVSEVVAYLCREDPDSRTPDEDGRRLIREGQFRYRVVTHRKYKELLAKEAWREVERERKRKERASSSVRTRPDRSGDVADTHEDEDASGSDSSSASEADPPPAREGLTWQRAGRLWGEATGTDMASFPLAYHQEHLESIARCARTEPELTRVLAVYVADDWVRENAPMPSHLASQWTKYARKPKAEPKPAGFQHLPLLVEKKEDPVRAAELKAAADEIKRKVRERLGMT